MAQVNFDQSATTRCSEHGRRAGALFVRPDAGEYFAAFYACQHCNPATMGTVSRDTAMQMSHKPKVSPPDAGGAVMRTKAEMLASLDNSARILREIRGGVPGAVAGEHTIPICGESTAYGEGCPVANCRCVCHVDLQDAMQIIKDACDRDWQDETPHQIAVIASNAMHWRNDEIRKLRDQNAILSGALNLSNQKQQTLRQTLRLVQYHLSALDASPIAEAVDKALESA